MGYPAWHRHQLAPILPVLCSLCAPSHHVSTPAPPALALPSSRPHQIGALSTRVRLIRIKNVLTGQEDRLEVPGEEMVVEIRERYMDINSHAQVGQGGVLVGRVHRAVKGWMGGSGATKQCDGNGVWLG